VTREAIAGRLAALREAGTKLRRRPARETLAALARVVDAWSDPDSPWRRALESELPAATGFSAPVVREGARRGFEGWSGRALRELAARELGGPDALDQTTLEMASGFDTTAVLLAGQIPMPTLLAVIAPLVLRSPVLLKPSSRDPVTPRLVARSVAEADAELGQGLELVTFARSDQACTRALLEADCVVASGSDATIAAVRATVRPPRRLVTYGHRLSLAALGAAATQGPELADAAERLALDVALWDQLGCLSPIAVYVAHPDSSAADRVAAALARALEQAEERLPRGRVAADAAAAIAHERAQAEMRAAAGRRVTLLAGARLAWTVVREDRPAPLPAPLHRFLRVHPVKDPTALVEALRPLGPHLAAVAIEGFGADAPALARALADLGASRICRPGTLQSPPLAWRHDNRGLLSPLARFADLEAPPR
jgi:hypothetical protein